MFENLQKLLTNKKIIRHYVERHNREQDDLGPLAVEFHWTSACNYDCIHCSYGSRRQDKGRLSEGMLYNTIAELAELGTKAVYLSGGGEPTTLPKWNLLAETILDSNIDVALITNGVLINELQLELIRKMNYIAVSIYSTNKQSYGLITGADKFEQQFNLPKLIKSKPFRCIVGARCVINSTNYQDIISIYTQAINAQFDYIIFIPAIDYEKRGVALTFEELEYVQRLIRRHVGEIDSSRTNLESVLKNGVKHYEPSNYRNTMMNTSQCEILSLRTNAFINYDGGVYICQPHIGNKDYCIGNLYEKPFKQIWNSARHKDVLCRLHHIFARGECSYCRGIGFNIEIDSFKNNLLKDDFL